MPILGIIASQNYPRALTVDYLVVAVVVEVEHTLVPLVLAAVEVLEVYEAR